MTELDALRQQRLRRTLAAVAAAHPYYRTKFKALGIAPGDIGSLDDLARLPPTAKQDYISDPEAFRLVPDDLPAADLERIMRALRNDRLVEYAEPPSPRTAG